MRNRAWWALVAGILLLAGGLLLWALLGERTAQRSERSRPRVLLIGLDGADWRIIEPLFAEGALPNLQAIVDGGVSAPLRTIEPMLSPVIWTTIATGRAPEDHGIGWFMSDTASGEKVPVTSTARRTKALWNILTESGLTSAIVGWWATYPAEQIDGEIVSDYYAFHNFGNTGEKVLSDLGKVWPPDFGARVAELWLDRHEVAYEAVQALANITREEYETTEAKEFTFEDPLSHLVHILASTLSYERIAVEVVSRKRDLTAVYFEGIDSVSHLFMKFAPPKMDSVSEEGFARFQNAVRGFYLLQDEVLGRLLRTLGPETVVMIVSDHGFRSGTERLPENDSVQVGTAHLWHTRYGIFAARGPGVRVGIKLPEVTVYDIAPTILYLLGLPVAKDMPGHVVIDALEPQGLRPQRTIESYEEGRALNTALAKETEQSVRDMVVERLQSLGYVGRDGEASSELHLNNAERLIDAGEWRRAEEELQRALRINPGNAQVHFDLARVKMALGDAAAAHSHAELAVQMEPESFSSVLLRGRLQAMMGDLQAARLDYEKAHAMAPARPFPLVALGDVLNRLGEYDLALEALSKALAISPTDTTALYNMGVVEAARGHAEKAEELYRRVLELDPLHEHANNNLGNAYSNRGEYLKATQHFEKALQAAPRSFDLCYNLGTCYVNLGRADRAVEVLHRALDLKPESHAALSNLAVALLGNEKPAQALQTYLTITKLYPSDYNAWMQAARLFLAGEQMDDARRCIGKARECDPDQFKRDLERFPRVAALASAGEGK
ncbi:MAG: tetratricopeptide repeat protein [Planctomycetota bacterium]